MFSSKMASSNESSDEDSEKFACIAKIVDSGDVFVFDVEINNKFCKTENYVFFISILTETIGASKLSGNVRGNCEISTKTSLRSVLVFKEDSIVKCPIFGQDN